MLHHPNIIAYYDSFEEDGTLMIEMEYADGGYVSLCSCAFVCLHVFLCVHNLFCSLGGMSVQLFTL